SLKYAFNDVPEPLIRLAITRNGSTVVVVYEDNGPGLPDCVDFDGDSGFGMQLISILVQQLRGSIRVEREHGACFVFEFNA
ncbi:MAG: sensor histidine kinase, partial [Spirochaetales bacterium]|nr:sensor histidine kinase [Spirochaetales bacterium]